MKYQVTVKTGTSREEAITSGDDSLIVYLRAKPHDGEANSALIKLLSKHFDTAKTNISIIKGQKSKQKIVQILS